MAIINFVDCNFPEKVYAHRFPNTNLSSGTKLLVKQTQQAVLFLQGKFVRTFDTGTHTLDTENIPILRSLYGIPYGGKNPYTAEVYFINKLLPLNIDWHAKMKIKDAEYNSMIPLIALGRYGLKIVDPEKFLAKLVGTMDVFTADNLTDHFLGELESRTKGAITLFMDANKIGLTSVSGYLPAISDNLKQVMMPFWESYGFEMIGFYITTIDVDQTDPLGAKVADAMARQTSQSIGGYTWQQSQVFETAQSAITNVGGGKGAGGLLGAVIAANMMGGMGAAAGGAMMQPQPMSAPGSNNRDNTNSNNQQKVEEPVLKEVFCSNCNKRFSTSMKFCPHCGDVYSPCPKCATDNDTRAKRCVNCGTQLSVGGESTCKNCQHSLPAGVAFCPNCGNPASEGQCPRCNTPTNGMSFCPACGNKVK